MTTTHLNGSRNGAHLEEAEPEEVSAEESQSEAPVEGTLEYFQAQQTILENFPDPDKHIVEDANHSPKRRIKAHVGVDLGSSDSKVVCFVQEGKDIYVEYLPTFASAVAYRDGQSRRRIIKPWQKISAPEILGRGESAREKIGRQNHGTLIAEPIRQGVIHSSDMATELARHAVEQIVGKGPWIGSKHGTLLLGIPYDKGDLHSKHMTSIALKELGFETVEYAYQSTLAAFGAGINGLSTDTSTGVLDVGHGTSDLGFVVDGTNAYSTTIDFAGEKASQRVSRALCSPDIGIKVSDQEANRLKIMVCSYPDATYIEVRGKKIGDTKVGQKAIIVPTKPIQDAIKEASKTIAEEVLKAIARMPHAHEGILADISKSTPTKEDPNRPLKGGMVLTGGGAKLLGLAEELRAFDIDVFVAPEPRLCVVKGMEIALGHPEILKKIRIKHLSSSFRG